MNPLYKNLLQSVETAIAELEVPKEPSNLYDPVKYTMSLGGKRVRPVLTLLGAMLYGADEKAALPQAIAVEIFHNFTLVHDDVMDSADVRRKLPTVHKKWNANIALLSGDAMLVMAYQHLFRSSSEHFGRLQQVFSDTAMLVCEGQQLDMDYASSNDIRLDDYMHMIRLKTAVLLSGSLKLGAIVAGAPSGDFAQLDRFAESVGLAFQLKDDLLDTFGGEAFGKAIGGDIREGKRTWLLIKALELANDAQRGELHLALSSNDLEARVKTITALYSALGVDRLAESEVERYSVDALDALAAIDGNTEAKECLQWLVAQLIERSQ